MVETKSRPGRLLGDAGTWTWESGGKLYSVDNPLIAANLKAKKLRALLERQKASKRHGQLPFLEALVFCSAPDLCCELTGNARYRVCLRDRAAQGDTPARPGILAHRAAPVQVSWLGYPGTLAAHADYVIADAVTIPPGAESDWSEAVVRLPLYQPNDTLAPAIPPPSRAEAGLPNDAFVFCCFNNPAKITPETFGVWMAMLKAAPASVLWLYASAVVIDLKKAD